MSTTAAPNEPSFAALVAKWEAITESGHNGNTDAFAAFLMPEVLLAIREQQAALAATLTEHPDKYREQARATLDKWKLP